MPKRVETVKDMTVLLSLHDVTPAFEDDIVTTYDMLSDFGITSMTLLVTPFYGLKKINKMSLAEIEAKLEDVKEKMGGWDSKYAQQLIKRKNYLESFPI